MTHEERLKLVASLVRELQPMTDKKWRRLTDHIPRLGDSAAAISTDYAKVLWKIAQREGVVHG